MIGSQFVDFCLSSYEPKWSRLCSGRHYSRVNTLSTTTWNILRLWQCKGSKSGRNEVTSKLDVAEFRTRNLCCSMCVQKRQASDDAGVAESFVFNQARKIWMLRWQVLWLMSLSPSFPCPSVRNLSFPAPNHDASCPPLQAMVAPNQLEHGQDSSCPPVLSDTRPYWPRKHDVQVKVLSRHRVFMKQLLGHRTRVTLRSSPRQDDQNLNFVNSCVGPAETALVSSTCTVTAQSFEQGDLVACEASIYWILLDLRYLWAKTCKNTIFAAHWLPSMCYWCHSFGFIWQRIIWRTFEVK